MGREVVRSFDAEFLNRLVNDPSTEAGRLGLKDLDLTEVLADHDNVFLANSYGGFLFVRDRDVYEVHTNFLPRGRGPKVYDAARAAAFYMFTETDCLAIRTMVPRGNLAAKALTERMGFTRWGDTEVNGVECGLYMLTLKEWCRRHKCR